MLKKAWNAIRSAAPPGEGKLVTVNFKDGQKARAALSKAGLKVSWSKGDWNTGRWYLRLDMPKKETKKAVEKAQKTLDGAGIMFSEKRFDELAEMMARLKHDGEFREAVLKSQRARLDRYANLDLEAELKQLLLG